MTTIRFTLSLAAIFLSSSLWASEPQAPVLPVAAAEAGSCYAIDTHGAVIWDAQPEADFPQLIHEHIYPNIDLIVYREVGKVVAYEFVVYPGGDPSQIRYTEAMPAASASQNLTGVTPQPVSLDWTAQADGWQPLTGPYEQAQILTIRMERDEVVE